MTMFVYAEVSEAQLFDLRNDKYGEAAEDKYRCCTAASSFEMVLSSKFYIDSMAEEMVALY